MINMIVKYCKCHEVPAENCDFIKTLRDLRADKFADSLIREVEIPEWTSSNYSAKS